MRTRISTGAACLLGALLASGTALEPPPLAGQEQPAQASERGWLGVAVHEVLECRVRGAERGRCTDTSRKLVVAEVVVDGPADRAGVQVGDTLLALDGERLDEGTSEAVFNGLRPDVPTRLEVGRPNGRRQLSVTPGGWPSGPIAVRVPSPSGATRVVRRPDAGAPAPRAVAEPGRRALILRGEAGGVYQVQPRLEVTVQLGSGDERRVVLTQPGRIGDALVWSPEAVWPRVDEEGRSAAYVVGENVPQVLLDPGPELRALQDSVFRAARSRLESLQRAFAANEERYRAVMEASARAEGRRGLGFSFGLGRSVAGAEFEPLNRELSEFFEGADQGLLCLRVVADTPADRLGLRPGDVLVEVAGRPVRSLDELRGAFRRTELRPIQVRWVRKGEPMTGTLTGG